MQKPDQAAHVAIFRNDNTEVLLTLRADMPLWVLPGGHKEDNESIEKAAIREVFEETNLTINDVSLVAIYSDKNKTTQKFLYKSLHAKGDAKLSSETADIEWFPVESLPFNLLNYEEQRIRLALKESSDLRELHLKIDWRTEISKFSTRPLFLLELILYYLKSKISGN